MKAEYRRELNRNYLILPHNTDSYEIQMVCKNTVNGFISAQIIEWDDEKYLYYDITAKQPIDKAFAKRKIGINEIKEILFSMDNVTRESNRYLLDLNNVLLEPEYVFWDMKEDKLEWILYPHNNKDTMNNLLEFLLERMDASDSEVVRITYELYRRLKDNSLSETDYSELLKEELPQRQENLKEEILEADSDTADSSNINKDRGLSNILGNIFKKKDKKIYKDEWIKAEETFESNNYDEYEIPTNGETTCLAYNNSEVHRLVSVGNNINDIELVNFPYLIGSKKEYVDIYVNDKAVSRMHAQIISKEEKVY